MNQKAIQRDMTIAKPSDFMTLTISTELSTSCSKLDVMTMRTVPPVKRTNAKKSFCHVNFSSRKRMADNCIKMMVMAQLHEISVKLMNGRMAD